ncbi:MAG: DsbA family oxidoreductase [Ornithinimicrobium sp.]
MTTPSLSSLANGPLLIEVWSDVVCPWCYIGKRRLESALARSGPEGSVLGDVQVRWRSFQLDPSAPRPGESGHGTSVAEHLGRKYGGGPSAGAAMSAQMTEVAAGEGLDFHLEDARVGNTTDAHRLLHLAAEMENAERVEGARADRRPDAADESRDDDLRGTGPCANLQDRLKERLLAAYFTQGIDISDSAVLRELAVEVGIPAPRVDDVLGSQAYQREVQHDQAQAQAYGATGVPFTVIDGRYGISGAQPVEVFVETIERAIADRAPQLISVPAARGHDSVDATHCGPGGCDVP